MESLHNSAKVTLADVKKFYEIGMCYNFDLVIVIYRFDRKIRENECLITTFTLFFCKTSHPFTPRYNFNLFIAKLQLFFTFPMFTLQYAR